MTEAEEKAKIEKIVESARVLVRIWDEFDGDPSCVGEYLEAHLDAVDEYGD
jgi:hypothetical protein